MRRSIEVKKRQMEEAIETYQKEGWIQLSEIQMLACKWKKVMGEVRRCGNTSQCVMCAENHRVTTMLKREYLWLHEAKGNLHVLAEETSTILPGQARDWQDFYQAMARSLDTSHRIRDFLTQRGVPHAEAHEVLMIAQQKRMSEATVLVRNLHVEGMNETMVSVRYGYGNTMYAKWQEDRFPTFVKVLLKDTSVWEQAQLVRAMLGIVYFANMEQDVKRWPLVRLGQDMLMDMSQFVASAAQELTMKEEEGSMELDAAMFLLGKSQEKVMELLNIMEKKDSSLAVWQDQGSWYTWHGWEDDVAWGAASSSSQTWTSCGDKGF